MEYVKSIKMLLINNLTHEYYSVIKQIGTVSPKQQYKWYIVKKLTSEKTKLQSTSIFPLNPIATKLIDLRRKLKWYLNSY